MRSSIYLWCTNIRHYSIQKGIKVMSNNLSKLIKELTIGKNGRTKNYYISQKLQQCHKKIPSYYVGEWDKKNNFWLLFSLRSISSSLLYSPSLPTFNLYRNGNPVAVLNG